MEFITFTGGARAVAMDVDVGDNWLGRAYPYTTPILVRGTVAMMI